MRKSYKGEVVIDKATLVHIGGIYADISKELSEAMIAPGFNESSTSGAMLKSILESYNAKSEAHLIKASEVRAGRPSGETIKLARKIGRPRKVTEKLEDYVFELVEDRMVILEVLKEPKVTAIKAMHEIFKERVLTLHKTNTIDTYKKFFGRFENAYKRAKTRKAVKSARSD